MKSEVEEASFFRRCLIRLVSAVCRFPRLVLILALLGCAFSLYAAGRFLQYHTERSDLVSPNKIYQQRWHQYLQEFGDDDDIVVVVQGTERSQMEQALEALAEQIGSRSNLFDRLFYKVDLRSLHRRALLFLPTEQIQQIQENLGSMKLLLEFGPIGWKSLTVLSLLREARHRAGLIQPGERLKPADDQFLTQLLSISKTATESLAHADSYHNPWSSLVTQPSDQKDLLAEPQYFFSGDQSLAFLLARPVKEPGSFTGAKKSVDAMRDIVADIGPQFPAIQFGLTGLPVLETDEMAAAEHDTHVASCLATLGVTILFFLVYRSLYYPLLTVGTLLVGTSWALGWTTLTVGHLNILSATFAVMLIGMGDYGVLWVMRYEHERKMGADVETALRHAAVCVGAGTLTASAAAALAFFAAMLADFRGVAELGWIAGSGVVLCAFSCFTVLPALLKLFDRRSFSEPAIIQLRDFRGGEWLKALAGRSKLVIASSLGLMALLGFFAARVTYDHNLLHLQARGLDSVKWELTLIEHTAGASWHALSYTTSPEEALALRAHYEKLPEVSRVVEVASLIPRDQDYKIGLLGDIQTRLRNLPEAGASLQHAPPNIREIRNELACLIGQLQPLADSCPQPLLADMRRSLSALYDRLGDFTSASSAETHLQEFEEKLVADLATDLRQLRDVAQPQKITLADLPMALRERYIGRTGKWLLQVYGKDSLWDFQPLEHFVKQIQTVDPDATGKPFGTVEGLRSMKNGFLWAGLYAFCAIVAVLLNDFRNLAFTAIALAPLAMGVILALGIMGIVGLPLNPANMIALPLILGVGVDNGVHVLHDFLAVKREGKRILSRAIGRGVLVKALTAMIGFGTLMISSQRGLAGLGLCLTLGMACCMLAALVFLPAVLKSCNGREPIATSKRFTNRFLAA
jgi:hopanoid biosynthesis associated RND transporter like protein HpnN